MKSKVVVIAFLLVLLAGQFCNVGYAENYVRVFRLYNRPGGSVRYSLTVSVIQSLYDYYKGKSHVLVTSADFAKFITPYSVKPIADKLWEVYSDDEIFADAVLSIAHQIPYEVSSEVYPVETLVLNYGDCGSLSLLVASILKAGGLDVVLLEYESKNHLNVGVNLSHKPIYVRGNSYYVVFGGKNYYVAESTGDNFPDGWRVGECPPELKSINPRVITVENYEKQAPQQVVATYKTLNPSQISISISSWLIMEDSIITISGAVTPARAEKVSIYVNSIWGTWQVLDTVNVNADGTYIFQWQPQSGGIYYIRASWSGDEDYAGADSNIITLYVIPFYGVVAGVLIILLLILLIIFRFMSRRGMAPPPPETPEKAELPPPPPSAAPKETQTQPQEESQPQFSQAQEETTQAHSTQPTSEENTATTEEKSSPPSPEQSQPTTSVSEPQSPEEQHQPEPQTQEEQPAGTPTETQSDNSVVQQNLQT